MDLLVKERDNHFLFPDNPNFFATTATDGYLDSCKIMRQMKNLAKLDRPELITSTSLRKYVATVIQVYMLLITEFHVHKQFKMVKNNPALTNTFKSV